MEELYTNDRNEFLKLLKSSKGQIVNDELPPLQKTSCQGKVDREKSPGFDRITNEMLKCTNSQGIKILTILFNEILKSGIFPTSWN